MLGRPLGSDREDHLGELEVALRFLRLLDLQLLLLILAAFLGIGFLHSAIAALTGFRFGQAPAQQFPHAVMEMHGCPAGDAQVKDGKYGKQELFHSAQR